MSINRNGIEFFTPDEDASDHPAFRLLDTVTLGDVRFPFGFFIVEEDGEKFVLPATAEQRINMLSKAFPDQPRSSWENACRSGVGSSCKGECDIGEICSRGFDSEVVQYGCACIPAW
jgi:hypothetical protein